MQEASCIPIWLKAPNYKHQPTIGDGCTCKCLFRHRNCGLCHGFFYQALYDDNFAANFNHLAYEITETTNCRIYMRMLCKFLCDLPFRLSGN